MAQLEVSIDRDEIQRVIQDDRGLAGLVEQVLNQLLEAEITQHLGAGPHERSPERRGRRNGHYRRVLTTRVGSIELKVPRDREGRFQTELFERYQRSEKALVLSLLEMVVNGVSTRKVARITEELCGREFKRSTVSDLAKRLDAQVEAWSERPLEGAFPFLIVDAMQIKVRREEAVRPTSVLIAIGVNEEGRREIVALRVADSESEQSWRDLFGDLKRRGLGGVEFVVSDAHGGLVKACKRAFQGVIWQRCQVHFRRNVVDRAPKKHHDALHRALDRILDARDPEQAREAFRCLCEELEGKADRALETLEAGLEDAIQVLVLPEKYRRRLKSTNMLERLIQEARRREKVIRIFPNERSAWRLLGALLAEQHEIWVTGRRWLNMDTFWE
ncbi:MAG: IS256 family transposase, partial [Gammaproteobacteria bacterium]|nr:IS256 family transposase [Gammaproteobacteria bacterium]